MAELLRGESIYKPIFVSVYGNIPTRFTYNGQDRTVQPNNAFDEFPDISNQISINQRILVKTSELLGVFASAEEQQGTINDVAEVVVKGVYAGTSQEYIDKTGTYSRGVFYILIEAPVYRTNSPVPRIRNVLQDEDSPSATLSGLSIRETRIVKFEYPNGVVKYTEAISPLFGYTIICDEVSDNVYLNMSQESRDSYNQRLAECREQQESYTPLPNQFIGLSTEELEAELSKESSQESTGARLNILWEDLAPAILTSTANYSTPIFAGQVYTEEEANRLLQTSWQDYYPQPPPPVVAQIRLANEQNLSEPSQQPVIKFSEGQEVRTVYVSESIYANGSAIYFYKVE